MSLKIKWLITFAITILVISHIGWDYYNGAVPVHNVLANEELPGISNWWGLLTIPVLTWIVLSIIFRKSKAELDTSKVMIGFLASLIFGIVLSVLWAYDMEEIMAYIILTPVVLSLFVKVHKPECLLGFVLGMTYTFGGVLPIGIGLVLLTLSFIAHLIFNKGIRYLLSKMNTGKA